MCVCVRIEMSQRYMSNLSSLKYCYQWARLPHRDLILKCQKNLLPCVTHTHTHTHTHINMHTYSFIAAEWWLEAVNSAPVISKIGVFFGFFITTSGTNGWFTTSQDGTFDLSFWICYHNTKHNRHTHTHTNWCKYFAPNIAAHDRSQCSTVLYIDDRRRRNDNDVARLTTAAALTLFNSIVASRRSSCVYIWHALWCNNTIKAATAHTQQLPSKNHTLLSIL